MVLAAMTPISAAGLVSEAGRAWFWKSLRWFHAAAFTPVLMVLVLGVGVQMTTGVANGLADKTAAGDRHRPARGDLDPHRLPSPRSALFKLLAFVDPGTSSGAALRPGLAAAGGLRGLLSGSAQPTAGRRVSAVGRGRSDGEAAAEDSTECPAQPGAEAACCAASAALSGTAA